jgi:hypothetical protein
MKMRTVAGFILAGILLCLGIAWSINRTARHAEQEAAFLAKKNTRLAAEIRNARDALKRVQQANADSNASRSAQTAPVPSLKTSTVIPSRLVMPDTPTLQNLKLAARRAQLATTYGPFYRSLNLSPGQITEFENALMRREEQTTDLYAAAQSQDASPGHPAFRNLIAQAEREYQTALGAILGDSGAQQFREYERTSMLRETVSSLAGAAAMAGIPLDSSQAEQLTRALANASPDYRSGGRARSHNIDWEIADQQAATFLSGAQLIFLKTTEPRGPRGAGGRFLPQLNAAIDAAAKQEAAAAAAAAK